jgi:PAS domain S-box-containing protein
MNDQSTPNTQLLEELRSLRQRVAELETETTELRQTHAHLQQRCDELREAQRLAQIGSWTWHYPTDKVEWSAETYRIYGLEPAEYAPSLSANAGYTHPDDIEPTRQAIAQALDRREPGAAEQRIVRPDGEMRTLLLRFEGRFDERGRPTHVTGAVQDITDHKREEAARQRREDVFATALNTSSDCIFIKNLDGKYLLVNQAIAALYGSTPQAMLGKTDVEFAVQHRLTEEEAHKFFVNDREVIQTRRIKFIDEESFSLPDGATRWFQTTKVPLTFQDDPECMLGIARDITDRKQAEQALRDKNAELENILRALPDALVYADTDRRIQKVNPAFTRIYGYTPEEVLSRKTAMLYASEHEFYEQGSIRYNVHVRELYAPYEIAYRRKNGEVFPSETVGTPVVDANGEPLGFFGLVRDITDRKQAETMLRRYALIISTIHDLMSFVDRHYIYQTVNDAYSEFFQTPVDEIIGRSLPDLFGSEVFEQDIKPYLDRCLTGEEVRYQVWVAFPGSGKTYMDVHYYPFVEADGTVSGVISHGRDITTEKMLQDRLREAEHEWRASFDSLEDIMLIIAPDFTIEKINRKGLQLLGESEDELLGKKCYEVIRNVNAPPAFCPLQTNAASQDIASVTFYDARFDRHFLLKSAPVIDAQGNVIKFVDLLHDVTERVEAENRLKASLAEKEMLLKEIHHRVKNNLQIVSSLLSLQLFRVEDAHVREILQASVNRVRSLAEIHKLLYESDSFLHIDFHEYLQQMSKPLIESYSPGPAVKLRVAARGIILTIEQAIPCALIMHELVANAFKYAFPGGQSGEIHVQLARTDEQYELTVSNNGVNFPDDVDIRNTTSLGMTLVTTLTTQLRGTIQLDKEQGTVFTIQFPTAQSGSSS